MRYIWLVLPLIFLSGCKRAAPDLSLRVEPAADGQPGRIVVRAPDESFWRARVDASGQVSNAAAALQVRVIPEGVTDLEAAMKKSADGQPLFGTGMVKGREWMFIPAAPLQPGQSYSISFDPSAWGLETTGEMTFATGSGPVSANGEVRLYYREAARPELVQQPAIESIHPTADRLPANHLKFYLTFSQPMEQGVFMERVRLRRADRSEIAGPFRETELWSPDGRRLTIWLHPGRQKTGVNLNEDEGAVLREGEAVTLIISGQWRAANGQPLGADVECTYQVGAADHEQPALEKWKPTAPKGGTREPLRIAFPEPLDWALLQNSLTITDARQQAVAGAVEIAPGEREWRFVPQQPWRPGEHQATAAAILEDLAGNNLDRLFETESDSPVAAPSSKLHQLKFLVE